MPFQEPNRRDSWPPTILRLQDENDNDDDRLPDDMDENPFAYFLTSPTPNDDDDYDEDAFDFFEDLSAGIEGGSRSPFGEAISSSTITSSSTPLDKVRSLTFPFTLPLSLSDFTSAHKPHHKGSPPPEHPTDTDRILAATSMRGRHPLRGRGRGQTTARARTRSLSGPRSRSWREPSPEIGSIPEEGEEGGDLDDVPALGNDAHGNDDEMDGSRKGAAGEGNGNRKKTVKKVHWATLPVRDA